MHPLEIYLRAVGIWDNPNNADPFERAVLRAKEALFRLQADLIKAIS